MTGEILTQADKDWMKEQKLKKKRKIEERKQKLIKELKKRQARNEVHIMSSGWHHMCLCCLFCGKKGCIISLTLDGRIHRKKIGNLCYDCYDVIKILPNVGIIKA